MVHEGEIFRNWLNTNKIGVQEVAEKLGVSRQNVSAVFKSPRFSHKTHLRLVEKIDFNINHHNRDTQDLEDQLNEQDLIRQEYKLLSQLRRNKEKQLSRIIEQLHDIERKHPFIISGEDNWALE